MSEQTFKSKHHIITSLIVIVSLSVIFGFVAGFVASQPDVSSFLRSSLAAQFKGVPILSTVTQVGSTAPSTESASVAAGQTEEARRIAAIARAMPAVVSVVISKDVPVFEQYFINPFGENNPLGDIFGGEFNVPQVRQKGTEHRQIGAGTGFIVSENGLIITNKHVVADESADYTVITSDGEKHNAKILARDPANDLAVLKIDVPSGAKLPFISSSKDDVKVGQSVIAIGYALGELTNSVSTGVVSGVLRNITAGDGRGYAEELYGLIQTDAAINPGNSGGPLLNLDGEAVGINVAVEQSAQSIGFALPINDVERVVESVKQTGKISRPFLGVRYLMIDPDVAKNNQLPVDYGALVARGDKQTDLAVTPGSPADRAGIVENDILLEVNGEKLTSKNPLTQVVSKFKVGEVINVKLLHKGEEKTVQMTLTERK